MVEIARIGQSAAYRQDAENIHVAHDESLFVYRKIWHTAVAGQREDFDEHIAETIRDCNRQFAEDREYYRAAAKANDRI
jgi:hypothetical protein